MAQWTTSRPIPGQLHLVKPERPTGLRPRGKDTPVGLARSPLLRGEVLSGTRHFSNWVNKVTGLLETWRSWSKPSRTGWGARGAAPYYAGSKP